MKTILFYLTNVLDFLRSNLNATYFYENLSTTIVLCPFRCPTRTSQTQATYVYRFHWFRQLHDDNTDFFRIVLGRTPLTIYMYLCIKNHQLMPIHLDNL